MPLMAGQSQLTVWFDPNGTDQEQDEHMAACERALLARVPAPAQILTHDYPPTGHVYYRQSGVRVWIAWDVLTDRWDGRMDVQFEMWNPHAEGMLSA